MVDGFEMFAADVGQRSKTTRSTGHDSAWTGLSRCTRRGRGPMRMVSLSQWLDHRWVDDAGNRPLCSHMNSVMLSFSCRRLDHIQSATMLAHSVTLDRNRSTCDGEQQPYIWVLSAYRCGESPRLSTSAIKSAVYRTNKIGPITEP